MRFNHFRPRKRPTPGKMNKLEKLYSDYLEHLVLAGHITRYRYEPLKFKLAPNTFYTPDFMVTLDDRVEIHETKGFMRDDANVKLKVVAEMYPEFLFCLVTRVGKEWHYEYK